jgi:cell division topological specificity factor
MTTWLKAILGGNRPPSGSIAKNRLQMVLTHDRGEMAPGLMEEIRDDIVEMLARRLCLDREKVVVQLWQTPTESRLVAEIPLQRMAARRKR